MNDMSPLPKFKMMTWNFLNCWRWDHDFYVLFHTSQMKYKEFSQENLNMYIGA